MRWNNIYFFPFFNTSLLITWHVRKSMCCDFIILIYIIETSILAGFVSSITMDTTGSTDEQSSLTITSKNERNRKADLYVVSLWIPQHLWTNNHHWLLRARMNEIEERGCGAWAKIRYRAPSHCWWKLYCSFFICMHLINKGCGVELSSLQR